MANSKYITSKPAVTYWEWWLLFCALCAVSLVGCATGQCRLPRIDPSGDHIFLPYDAPEPPPYRPPIRGGGPTLVLPNGPQTLPAPAVPPPLAGTPIGAPPFPTTQLPQPAVIPPLPNPYVATPDPTGISVSPARIIAPVGSEVVLLASICGGDGFMVTGEAVQWSVNPLGVGHIVALGERGYHDWIDHLHGFPRKLTDHYAMTRTCVADMYLDRGTPNPADDVTVLPGQTWISVSSPVEGTSHVTAIAASTYNWDRRQQTALIHWIDAQFTFPAPSSAAAGSRVPLTTKVTRLTNGAPLDGWVVRYELAPGGPAASFAGSSYDDSAPKLSGGQSGEATTNAQGEATIELVQDQESGGTSSINIQVLRPPGLVPGESQRVTVGQGATSVSWTGAPTAASGTPTLQPDNPPSLPSRRRDDTPPPQLRGEARLTIDVTGPTSAQIGDDLDFQVIVTNTGDEEATNVVIRDRFDAGLELPGQRSPISTDPISSIAPGKRKTIKLQLRAVESGQQCQTFTATADGQVRSNSAQACTQIVEKEGRGGGSRFDTPPGRFGGGTNPITVTIRGPDVRKVGETAEFFITVTNNSSDLARGVKLIFDYNRGLLPKFASDNVNLSPTPDGYSSMLGDILAGKSMNFQINCECVRAAPRACVDVKISVRDLGTVSDEKCLEIQDDDNPQPPTLSNPATNRDRDAFGTPASPPSDRFGNDRLPPIGSSSSGPISVKLTRQDDTVRVDQTAHFHVEIQNTSRQDLANVAVQLNIPLGLNLKKVTGLEGYLPNATGYEIGPIRLLRAGETVPLDLEFTAKAPGRKSLEVKAQTRDRRSEAASGSDTIDVVQ